MPFQLRQKLVLLGEGDADRRFLSKLIEGRNGFPDIDIPFIGSPTLHGLSNIGEMLKSLKGDPHGFSKLEGILIVADSADDPTATFNEICRQIGAQGFPLPPSPLNVAPKNETHPAVSVMLLPNENTPGSLESLFVEELERRRDWVRSCVETYLSCGESAALTWSAEKIAKARYGSMVAALHEDDPNRAVSWAFREPPIVPINSITFDSVERRIKDFCIAVGVPL